MFFYCIIILNSSNQLPGQSDGGLLLDALRRGDLRQAVRGGGARVEEGEQDGHAPRGHHLLGRPARPRQVGQHRRDLRERKGSYEAKW